IVDDGSRIGLEMKEIARHGHLDRFGCTRAGSVRRQKELDTLRNAARHSIALYRERLTMSSPRYALAVSLERIRRLGRDAATMISSKLGKKSRALFAGSAE